MKAYIIQAAQYWRNYRGECGSIHSVEKVFDSEDKASKYIANIRKREVNAMVKDTSDEPGRWIRLTDRATGEFKMDMWIREMEVE